MLTVSSRSISNRIAGTQDEAGDLAGGLLVQAGQDMAVGVHPPASPRPGERYSHAAPPPSPSPGQASGGPWPSSAPTPAPGSPPGFGVAAPPPGRRPGLTLHTRVSQSRQVSARPGHTVLPCKRSLDWQARPGTVVMAAPSRQARRKDQARHDLDHPRADHPCRCRGWLQDPGAHAR
jgi:hypothetical protein